MTKGAPGTAVKKTAISMTEQFLPQSDEWSKLSGMPVRALIKNALRSYVILFIWSHPHLFQDQLGLTSSAKKWLKENGPK